MSSKRIGAVACLAIGIVAGAWAFSVGEDSPVSGEQVFYIADDNELTISAAVDLKPTHTCFVFTDGSGHDAELCWDNGHMTFEYDGDMDRAASSFITAVQQLSPGICGCEEDAARERGAE